MIDLRRVGVRRTKLTSEPRSDARGERFLA